MGLVTALAAGATVLGGVLSSKSQSKAANTAADAQRDASAQNAAVQREQLQAAQGALNPYVQRGNAAGDTMNALLGLGGGQQQTPTPQPNALTQFYGGVNPDNTGAQFGGVMGAQGAFAPAMGRLGATRVMGGEMAPNEFWQSYMANPPQTPGIGAGVPQAPQGQTAQQAADNAFDIFRNSTGYQFRLGEGMDALNSGYAGAGVLQSGDAMRAATEYGQNFASNEFGNYMGYLGNQQGVGLSGASAIAGVGQNYANSISNNNNALASTLGNAALVKGANNPFANALGTIGGAVLGGGF